jgi:hypothetical protein
MRFFYALLRPSGLVPEGLFLFGFDLMAGSEISRGRVIAG